MRSSAGPPPAVRKRSSGLSQIPKHWLWRDGPEPTPGPAVLVDVDGVLSDASGRQHYLEDGTTRDWRGFFDACGEDAPIEEVARLVHLLDPALAVVLLTGRPVRVQDRTQAWLEHHGIRWDLLIMRDAGDYAAAREFKRQTVGELRDFGFDLRLAFEDDRRNLDMFHEEGVPCVYIHSGYYEKADT